MRLGAMGQAIVDGNGTAMATAAWPAASRAIYVPISLPFDYLVKRLFWSNGTTATGNVDVGIFHGTSLSKLVSTGAVAQSGTSTLQYVASASFSPAGDYLLTAGTYFLGASLSNTAHMFRSSDHNANTMRFSGVLQEASAHPLPSTITPAAVASAYWPLFGMTRTASGY